MAKKEMKVVGKSVPIMEAREKVTGRSLYVDDMRAELFVKILGSPHVHARVKRINVSRAQKLEGVKATLTHKEVPHRLLTLRSHRPCYVMDEHLRYVGDYVAAVAATNESTAEKALDLIDVDYDILPAVFDPEEAAKPTAPKIYPEGNVYETSPEFMKRGTSAPSLQEWGNISRGFDEADAVVEDNFDVTPQVHSPIEPHVSMARWQGDELTIWTATQTPWELRDILSHFFKIPENKAIVLTPNVGGGFGGKYTGRYQVLTCLLSRMAGGKLTKLTLTREEEQCYARRPRGRLYAKVGARNDGTITALQLRAYFDIGAYGTFITGSLGFHIETGILSYKIKNARFESWDVHTNHFRSECTRSVQLPFIAFAIESIVDEIAEKLGLDPVEIRLKNMPETGDMMPPTSDFTTTMSTYLRAKLDIYPGRKMMQQVLNKIEWKRKWKGFGKPTAVDGAKRRGIGLAYTHRHCGYFNDGGTCAQVIINRDGSATICSGAQEIGQGINTTLRMIAAESLGIPLEHVALVTSDTRTGQYDLLNARASRELATVGHILLRAIEEAKEKICKIVAPVFEVMPEEIEIKGKKAYVKGHPEGAKPLRDLMSTAVTGSATGTPKSVWPEVKPGFKAQQPLVAAAEVEVDIETGVVKPVKMVTGLFPGRMINKGIVRGQAIGGTIMSLGMALWEEVKFNEETSTYLGRDFTDYRIPRALDIPEIETVLLEQVDGTSSYHDGLPYGGRGIGESAAWGYPVAIANAIYNALGVRIKTSPMTAEAVLEALHKGPIK